MFPERFGDGDTSQAALELEEVFSYLWNIESIYIYRSVRDNI